jgi:hypothetical protein
LNTNNEFLPLAGILVKELSEEINLRDNCGQRKLYLLLMVQNIIGKYN